MSKMNRQIIGGTPPILLVIFTAIIAIAWINHPKLSAQGASASCQFMQGQLTNVEDRVASTILTLSEAQAQLDRLTDRMPMDLASLQELWLAGERPELNPEERRATTNAIFVESEISQLIENLVDLYTLLQSIEDAAFFVCLQDDTSAPTLGEDVLPTPSPASVEATPFVSSTTTPPVPTSIATTDDGTDGWEVVFQLSGPITDFRTDPETVREDEDQSFRLLIGDNGTLYSLSAYDRSYGAGCEIAGSVTFNGDQISVSFSGTYDGGPGYREGELTFRFGQMPDNRGYYPLFFEGGQTRTYQVDTNSGEIVQILKGNPQSQREAHPSEMERIGLAANYVDGSEYCGDGVP